MSASRNTIEVQKLMKKSKVVSTCGMMSALAVVIMFIGAITGLGVYIAPMIAGFIIVPVGNAYGKKYHIMLWLCISIICFMLITDIEQNLIFFTTFGLYPIIRPFFQKLPEKIGFIAKLIFFTIVFGLVELLVIWVLVPQAADSIMMILLIITSDICFMLYDRLIPYADAVIEKYLGKIIKRL